MAVETPRYRACRLHLVKRRRSSWVASVVLVAMISSTFRLQRGGVLAFVTLPTRDSRQRRLSSLQMPFRGTRVDDRSFQYCWSVLYSSSSSLEATITYDCLFDLEVPEGRCVGLQLPDLPNDHPDALVPENVACNNNSNTHWIRNRLHPDEIEFGMELHSDNNRKSFWMGRLAMRHALLELQPQQKHWDLTLSSSSGSILKDLYGRPQVPTGFLGSISHKRNTGVALVAKHDDNDCSSPPRVGIGVDIEEATNAERRSIARKVLTPSEQADLGRIPVSIAALIVVLHSVTQLAIVAIVTNCLLLRFDSLG
jgi:4'-phosphopantetheinyl transferase N-terminal domain